MLGLQFHLEMSPSDVGRIVQNCRQDLEPGPFVQREADILEGGARFDACRRVLAGLLERLAAA